MFKQMKPEDFISILDKHHADYNPDYIGSLTKDHLSENIFIRFVANVKLKRFFEHLICRRIEPDVRAAFSEIIHELIESIVEDLEALHKQHGFAMYRSFAMDPAINPFYYGGSRVIRYDEYEFMNLFGSMSFASYFKEALKEYWRLDQEPGILDTEAWDIGYIRANETLFKTDLSEFLSTPTPINEPQTTGKNTPEPQKPTVRTWGRALKYLGYITAELIEEYRGIDILPLSKVITKYFIDKNGEEIKHTTIRVNIQEWKNHKNNIDSHSIKETMKIMDAESNAIREVIEYFRRTH